MKRSKMKDHLERVHPDMKNKDVEFFKRLVLLIIKED
ncbi:hypothetical protein T09_14351 [Trichinella sp. T9]|nr:hypothetical protein T09_5402 [Trichinella sp. T9]KRX29163.1 hypothetical protein T09_14351 [Trichinella sp. T9]